MTTVRLSHSLAKPYQPVIVFRRNSKASRGKALVIGSPFLSCQFLCEVIEPIAVIASSAGDDGELGALFCVPSTLLLARIGANELCVGRGTDPEIQSHFQKAYPYWYLISASKNLRWSSL